MSALKFYVIWEIAKQYFNKTIQFTKKLLNFMVIFTRPIQDVICDIIKIINISKKTLYFGSITNIQGVICKIIKIINI